MSNILSNPEEFDDNEIICFSECPNCGKEYDEIDYDYQICHYCNYDANKTR